MLALGFLLSDDVGDPGSRYEAECDENKQDHAKRADLFYRRDLVVSHCQNAPKAKAAK